MTEKPKDTNEKLDYALEEWKNAREATSKFDEILVDLRKYGFSIITGIITADAFIGFSKPIADIQIGAIIVTMILIVILYWVDRYYDGLLWGAVMRTRFLETFRLERAHLSSYISGFLPDKIVTLLHYMYGVFLLGALILGLSVTSVAANGFDPTSRLNIVLFVSFSLAIVGMIATYVNTDRERKRLVCFVNDLFRVYKEEMKKTDVDKDMLSKELEGRIEKALHP